MSYYEVINLGNTNKKLKAKMEKECYYNGTVSSKHLKIFPIE